MQSRHFVVSVYAESGGVLEWCSDDIRDFAGKGREAEVIVTEIAPNIYITSPLAKQVAEAMTRQITVESGDAGG